VLLLRQGSIARFKGELERLNLLKKIKITELISSSKKHIRRSWQPSPKNYKNLEFNQILIPSRKQEELSIITDK